MIIDPQFTVNMAEGKTIYAPDSSWYFPLCWKCFIYYKEQKKRCQGNDIFRSCQATV